MSKQELKQKGFTIIEVVLVLAIAALIFLMVFIALPALQASQRDTARKNDVSIVASAINSWSSNNRGKSIGELVGKTLLDQYATSKSDNTTSIVVKAAATGDVTANDAEVTVYVGTKCDTVGAEGKVTLAKGTARQAAIVTKLEGGSNSGYCLES